MEFELNKDFRANDNVVYHETLHYSSGYNEEIPNHNRTFGSPDVIGIEYYRTQFWSFTFTP
jgi:hypothetical protein